MPRIVEHDRLDEHHAGERHPQRLPVVFADREFRTNGVGQPVQKREHDGMQDEHGKGALRKTLRNQLGAYWVGQGVNPVV